MKRPLKILIVADVLTTKTSGGKASNALVQGFIEQRYDLKILHYSREDINFDGTDTISIPEKKSSWSYITAKMQVVFQRATGRNINNWVEARNGFSYTHNYDVKSIKAAIKKERPQDYDYIVALSYASSFRAHKAILELSEWHHKFLPYVHDPFPMHSYPRPYDWVEPGHQKKRDFFVSMYTAAKAILYPSKMLGEWMESYYPTGKDKSVVIPHLIVDSLKDSRVYPPYFDPSKFNILYAGALMSARNPMALVQAFLEFISDGDGLDKQDHARLVIVSGDSIFDKKMKSLASLNSQLLISPKKEPFQIAYNMQQQAAVNVVLEAKGPASPFLPGKVPHCVTANKPILVLGPYYSETKRILGIDYPYWSEIYDVETIKKHISILYLDWKEKKGQSTLEIDDLTTYFESSSINLAMDIIRAKIS
ncbi:hypothetical protein [uncultured Nonlabens sp.]|uniref:hypothetical protein n=1 Tax=uncultured Nonlabens sp. TaxID=859306 RepID=UPI002638B881|nr:hypothetical protein [uncultured Nonlabens sp.]